MLQNLLSPEAGATKTGRPERKCSPRKAPSSSQQSSQPIDFLTLSDNERDLMKKMQESEAESDGELSTKSGTVQNSSGAIEVDNSSDSSKTSSKVSPKGRKGKTAKAKSPSKNVRKETRLRREEQLTKEAEEDKSQRISKKKEGKTRARKTVKEVQKSESETEDEEEQETVAVARNSDVSSDSDVQIVKENIPVTSKSPGKRLNLSRSHIERASKNLHEKLNSSTRSQSSESGNQSFHEKLEALTKNTLAEFQKQGKQNLTKKGKKTAKKQGKDTEESQNEDILEVPKEGKKTTTSKLKHRLLPFSSTDLESTLEEDSIKRSVKK